jgi:hypothetical protein
MRNQNKDKDVQKLEKLEKTKKKKEMSSKLKLYQQ